MDDTRYQGFVSYARDNDQPCTVPGPDGVCRGWVSTLHKELTRYLVQELRRTLRDGRRDGLLWIDLEQVRGGDALSPQIEAKLAASRLLLPILSPSWFDSEWCLKEFNYFLAAHPDADERVFPVWMRPVDAAALTGAARAAHDWLRQKTGFAFHYREGRHDRTRWDPPDPQDREYLHRVQDVASEMAERIAVLANREAAEGAGSSALSGPASGPAPGPAPGPLADSVPGSDPGPTRPEPAVVHEILVNGGIDDAARIQAVAEALGSRGHGYAVPVHTQPEQALTLKPSTVRSDLRNKLRRCTAVLFVYCDGPPHLVDEQIDLCDRAAAEPRDDRPPPTLDLCHYGKHALGLRPPRLCVHRVRDDRHCVDTFVAALRQRASA